MTLRGERAAAAAAGGLHAAAALWMAWLAAAAALEGGRPARAALLAAAAAYFAAVARAVAHLRSVLVSYYEGCSEREDPRPAGEAVEGNLRMQGAMVSDAEFERSVDAFMADLQAERAAHGRGAVHVYGPLEDGNVAYEVARESFVFLCGLRASLLQMAHPFVAVAVDTHSSLRNGPQQRFYRTFKYVFAILFGHDEEVVAAARAVRRLHGPVSGRFPETVGPYAKGTPYSAHQPHALLWVAATLSDSAVLAFELMVRRLSDEECERSYRGLGRFVSLFGVPAGLVPPTNAEFRRYVRRMWHSPALTVGERGRALHGFLVATPLTYLRPLMWWINATTAAVMPPRIAAGFGMRHNAASFAAFYLTFAPLRVVYGLLPGSARYLARYLHLESTSGGVRRAKWPSRLSAAFAAWVVRLAIGGGGGKGEPRRPGRGRRAKAA